MGARGPLPLTAHERRIRAGAAASPAPPWTAAEAAAGSRPSMPRTLGPEGRAEWRRVARALAERGLLDRADRAILTAYCRTWERWLELDALASSAGYDTKTPAGRALSPEFRALRETTAMLERLAAQLGLTPASRLRMPAPPASAPADPIVELINRGHRSSTG